MIANSKFFLLTFNFLKVQNGTSDVYCEAVGVKSL